MHNCRYYLFFPSYQHEVVAHQQVAASRPYFCVKDHLLHAILDLFVVGLDVSNIAVHVAGAACLLAIDPAEQVTGRS